MIDKKGMDEVIDMVNEHKNLAKGLPYFLNAEDGYRTAFRDIVELLEIKRDNLYKDESIKDFIKYVEATPSSMNTGRGLAGKCAANSEMIVVRVGSFNASISKLKERVENNKFLSWRDEKGIKVPGYNMVLFTIDIIKE